MTRAEVALYCQTVLKWAGVLVDDRSLWIEALTLWASHPELAWTDAVLSARMLRDDQVTVWTANRPAFLEAGLAVPDLSAWAPRSN